jgi:oxygen-independent coproporphyrinogen III oxidase
MGLAALISKYSTPGPRYTSYPTAPQWTENAGPGDHEAALRRVKPEESLALYVHLPFCEKLCYYCGCNIQITSDKGRSRVYVQRVIQELRQVAQILGSKRTLSQISWGGGTPTFLTLDEIRELAHATHECFAIDSDAEVSIEVDPRVTSVAQLELLRELGFNRTSLGVQDFNHKVQEAVNRIQSREMTLDLLNTCRRLGYDGINFDLIYGLPWQTLETFRQTIDQVVQMRPDRIALYNYARLPSLLKHQSILEKFPMPGAEERVEIFTMALTALTGRGYHAVGMDHFAVETDGLTKALAQGRLYRNFMGYTVKQGNHLIGVGCSAISEVGGGFFQNVKKPSDYESKIEAGSLATLRGIVLSQDDLRRKWIIQSLMCRFRLDPLAYEETFHEGFEAAFDDSLKRLEPFYADGILTKTGDVLQVTELGRLFVRNIAMAFDAYLNDKKATFSQTV